MGSFRLATPTHANVTASALLAHLVDGQSSATVARLGTSGYGHCSQAEGSDGWIGREGKDVAGSHAAFRRTPGGRESRTDIAQAASESPLHALCKLKKACGRIGTPGFLDRTLIGWVGNSGQYADNGDRDHELDQGEADAA